METTEHGSAVTYPILFIEREQDLSLPAPLVRVSCCGMLTLEVLKEVVSTDPPLGRYEVISTQVLRGRGAVPSMMLLKLLASQPHRFATKDWLATQMQQEMESGALVRLDTMASQLRKQFRGLQDEDASEVGLVLVAYLRNGRGSGPGYQLAPSPLIWLDTDALAWNVEQAARMERFGEDALPWWERAYALASRGEFLPDDPYSEWAQGPREAVEGALRQCVHALSRLYLSLPGRRGEEEAIRLLRSYWLRHQTDEDALRPLLELLGKRECYQEAELYYQQLCETLDAIERGKQPDARTRDLHAFLRLKQIQRPSSSSLVPAVEEEHSCSANSPQETRVVEATGSPLSDDQEFLLLADKPSDHTGPLLAETRHLIGRQEWLTSVIALIQAEIPKKLLVLHGPIGVGKSSELNRLAHAFVKQNDSPSQVIVLSLPAREPRDPEASLDLFLGMLLSESRVAPFPADASRQTRINLALTALAQRPEPTVILLDNAEGTLTEEGTLAACWEAFLSRVVRGQHQATLVLATKEWPGWTGRDPQLVAEIPVPPLTLEDSVLLLQRLGLESVPHAALETISQRVACIPLCLEWIAKIAHDPLVYDAWEGFEVQEETSTESHLDATAQRLTRLLQHPTLLGEHLASRLTPLLEHIIERHLSADARRVLERLALVTIPLAKPALQVLCPRPALLKELRDASLLAAYTNRVQLLPIVAFTVQQQLSSAQRQAGEALAIQAYTSWLNEGHLEMLETGSVVAELAVLLLTHHRFAEATELLIRLGWLSFLRGYGPRLALLAQEALRQVQWHQSIEDECVGLALINAVFPFLGEPLQMQVHGNYPRLRAAFLAGELSLSATIERSITHLLLLDAIESLRFEQGQAIVDAYCRYLQARQIKHPQQQTGLMQKQALLLGKWCDYLLEQQEREQASIMREQAIALHRQCATRFATLKPSSPVAESMRKRGLAYASAYLGYHLNQISQHEEALQMIEQAIYFHEQGYGHTSILADSYSEKAQALMALGRFQEALRFDEQAMTEIHRWAKEGDILSQKDVWTYQVNQGRLYVRLGRMEEAEQLLQEAEPRLSRLRRNYRMFAKDALEEIAQWRQQTNGTSHQLDWRWVERFRTLTAYDSYWWLTWAGPFTQEEQKEWDHLFALPQDETTKTHLGALITSSRVRELEASLAEQREPRLHYPAIEIEEICRRIGVQERLDADIAQQEPNVIVKRLYREAIAEELDYLHLIEATYERNTEWYWECAQRLFPLPSRAEMIDALGYVQSLIERGLAAPAAVQVTQQFQEYLSTQFHLSPDLLAEAAAFGKKPPLPASTSSSSKRSISAEAAQRFFTTVLRESGYEDWRVELDSHGGMARVERGARSLFLPDKRFSLAEVRRMFVHELAGHVGYCVAGDRSPLGLLGLQMKNSGPVKEGVALYHERQVLALHGEVLNDAGMRIGMLGVGLAAGVITPPQTFSTLCAFFEQLSLFIYALNNPQAERSNAQRQAARRYALDVCLRIYRGVPHLQEAGICYPQDAVHWRGLRLVEQAVAADASLLDRLSVGACPLEYLPDMQELGILCAPQPLLHLAYATDLDEYICSFETSIEKGGEKEERAFPS